MLEFDRDPTLPVALAEMVEDAVREGLAGLSGDQVVRISRTDRPNGVMLDVEAVGRRATILVAGSENGVGWEIRRAISHALLTLGLRGSDAEGVDPDGG